jgi:type IV secretory pathway component VirB8
MDQELLNKFEQQEKKIDAIYVSVEKTRKYFQWTLIITVLTIVLPIIAIIILLPWIMGTFSAAYSGLL